MHADALVSAEQILADAVLARTRITVVDQTVTVGTRPTIDTVALVSVDDINTGTVLART